MRVAPREGRDVKVRISGVDIASHGAAAARAMTHIESWSGRLIEVHVTCCGMPHGETPGIVLDMWGNNLGTELLKYGSRMHKFPIEL